MKMKHTTGVPTESGGLKSRRGNREIMGIKGSDHATSNRGTRGIVVGTSGRARTSGRLGNCQRGGRAGTASTASLRRVGTLAAAGTRQRDTMRDIDNGTRIHPRGIPLIRKAWSLSATSRFPYLY